MKKRAFLASLLVVAFVSHNGFAQPPKPKADAKKITATDTTSRTAKKSSSTTTNKSTITLQQLADRLKKLEAENKLLKEEIIDLKNTVSSQALLVNLLNTDHRVLKDNFKNHYHTILTGAWGNNTVKQKDGNKVYYVVTADPKAPKTKETSVPVTNGNKD